MDQTIMDKDYFRENVLPNIPNSKLLTKRSIYNTSKNTITLFENEVVENTFIVFNNCVYKLMKKKEELVFSNIGAYNLACALPFERENFEGVVVDAAYLVGNTPVVPTEKPDDNLTIDDAATYQPIAEEMAVGKPIVEGPVIGTEPEDHVQIVPLNGKNSMILSKADLSTLEGFDQFIDEQLAKIRHVLLVKGRENVRRNSRFSNFERTASIRGNTTEEALQGFLDKNLTNYFEMLDDIGDGKVHSEEVINEQFGEIVIYFLIQHAQFLRRSQLSQKQAA